MAGKKIIIIGSSSGLGKELARMYAQQNNLVAVAARRQFLLEELKAEYPENIITAAIDVTRDNNEQQIKLFIQQLEGLDLLIYNAGYGDPSEELIPETEIQTTLTNVTGFVSIVSYVFNYFVQQGFGQIALTSSLSALRGNGWTPAYSASKAYMSNYAEGLSIKAHRLKKNIAVTDIRPGFLDTKMAKANKRFWVVPVHKAAMQVINAIDKRKRVVYISRRWRLVAFIMKWMPFSIYKRIG